MCCLAVEMLRLLVLLDNIPDGQANTVGCDHKRRCLQMLFWMETAIITHDSG